MWTLFSPAKNMPGQKDSSNFVFVCFLCLCKNIHPLVTRQALRVCFIFKTENAHLIDAIALRTMTITSTKKFTSLFVHTISRRTHFAWEIHVPNKLNNDIVITTISIECDTHRNCSLKIHSCLQRDNGSCMRGKIWDG